METIFRLERERALSNDWVVRNENHFYQVERQSLHHAPAKSKVRVCEWEDGRIEIHYRGQKLSWKRIPAPASKQAGGQPPSVKRGDQEEVEAGTGPSLAERALTGQRAGVGLGLRFALNAPPFGLRRASLRPRPTP